MKVEQSLESRQISEDTVQQMLLLAERLRESHGGELDDEAIMAVSEATGAPVDYVRIAVARRTETEKQTITKKLRGTYLSLDPEERAWVLAGGFGAGAGVAYALNEKFPNSNGLFGIAMIVMIVIGLYTVATRKNSRMATIAGAILGCLGVISSSIFGLMLGLASRGAPMFILPMTFLGGLAGFLLFKLIPGLRRGLGLRDATEERQDLLRQLVELQDKLKTGEQSVTFLSVDIVGSTRMKVGADPLNVEFTFNEFHKFVERGAAKYGGRIHSTAGDGVTAAFDTPYQAFQAAVFIQVGIIEVNTFGNKLGTPIVMRCGVNTGPVVAPNGRDVTSVNFAHVIDVAAHLQKAAPAGGIAVSQEAFIHIPKATSIIGSERIEADGVSALVWRPKTRAAEYQPSSPPPVPGQA